MKLAKLSATTGPGALGRALFELETEWGRGEEPQIEALWRRHDPARTVEFLGALAKADLRCRFDRGGNPAAADYLARFPLLGETSDRVVSLVYEEFCLREERGDCPDPSSFCDRYAPWRDSLASQLEYHRMLSRAAGSAPKPPKFPEAGQYFLRYRLRRVLGQGGAARVFLAQDEDLGDKEVALKVSLDQGKEPSILGRLDHEHIVPVWSVSREPESGLRGLCMPYRPGLPLDAVVRRAHEAGRPRRARDILGVLGVLHEADVRQLLARPKWRGFPARGGFVEAAAWVVAALARALDHAHSRGVMHRDVKPANILLTASDGPQLLDFNLAHDPHDAGRAEAALRGGTLPYMAPEQLEAFLDPGRWDDVGPAADVYSLGLVLNEFLTGLRPGTPESNLSTPRAIRDLLDARSLAPPSPRDANPDVPHALSAVVAHCLATRPSDRYASAADLAEDLRRFLAGLPLLHADNRSRTEVTRNWARRRAIPIVMISVLLCATLPPLLRPQSPLPAPDAQAICIESQLFRQADREAGEGEYTRAAGSYLLASEKNPGLALPLACSGACLIRAGDLAKGKEYINKALKLHDAESAFELAVKKFPKVARLWVGLGIKLLTKRPPNAREAFENALAIEADLDAAHHGLATLDTQGRNFKKALGHFEEAIRVIGASNSDDGNATAKKLVSILYDRAQCREAMAESFLDPSGAIRPDHLTEVAECLTGAQEDLTQAAETESRLGNDRIGGTIVNAWANLLRVTESVAIHLPRDESNRVIGGVIESCKKAKSSILKEAEGAKLDKDLGRLIRLREESLLGAPFTPESSAPREASP